MFLRSFVRPTSASSSPPSRSESGPNRKRRTAAATWILGLGLVASLTACGAEEETVLIDDSALGARVDTTAEFSPLRFPDGELTLNDRCPVRKVPLNTRMPSIYVNQHPVGFC